LNGAEINAGRFSGFADIYDRWRPKCPERARAILCGYLEKTPETVVDLGCGTGHSALPWRGVAKKVVGVEPNPDMLGIARQKAASLDGIEFIQTCSQSFHWMEPVSTLREASRLLRPGGIFSAYDCDWPPVFDWRVENGYYKLFEKVAELEGRHSGLKESFRRWEKSEHLQNIKDSGLFRFAREAVFMNSEACDAERLIGLALSQGGLQALLKTAQDEISPAFEAFKSCVHELLDGPEFEINFCYRMRIGVK
jgi:SAM-dependent methyltransferase